MRGVGLALCSPSFLVADAGLRKEVHYTRPKLGSTTGLWHWEQCSPRIDHEVVPNSVIEGAGHLLPLAFLNILRELL